MLLTQPYIHASVSWSTRPRNISLGSTAPAVLSAYFSLYDSGQTWNAASLEYERSPSIFRGDGETASLCSSIHIRRIRVATSLALSVSVEIVWSAGTKRSLDSVRRSSAAQDLPLRGPLKGLRLSTRCSAVSIRHCNNITWLSLPCTRRPSIISSKSRECPSTFKYYRRNTRLGHYMVYNGSRFRPPVSLGGARVLVSSVARQKCLRDAAKPPFFPNLFGQSI